MHTVLNKHRLPAVTKIFKVCNGESFTDQCTKQLTLTYILKKKCDPIFSCYTDRIFSEYNNILDTNMRESLFQSFMHHIITKCIYLLFSLAMQPSARCGLLVSRGFLITHNDVSQSVLWTSDQLVAETST
jgi:hypothetical protein